MDFVTTDPKLSSISVDTTELLTVNQLKPQACPLINATANLETAKHNVTSYGESQEHRFLITAKGDSA